MSSIRNFFDLHRYWIETAGLLLIFIVLAGRNQISAYGSWVFVGCVVVALCAHYFAVKSRIATLKVAYPGLFEVFNKKEN